MARHYIWSYHFIVLIVLVRLLALNISFYFRLIHSQIIFLMRVQQHYRHILCSAMSIVMFYKMCVDEWWKEKKKERINE